MMLKICALIFLSCFSFSLGSGNETFGRPQYLYRTGFAPSYTGSDALEYNRIDVEHLALLIGWHKRYLYPEIPINGEKGELFLADWVPIPGLGDPALRGPASLQNWLNLPDNSEMVSFSGHGTSSYIRLQNEERFYITNPNCQKGLGYKWTRWVFLMGCKTLASTNPSTYSTLFNGLHGLFGYASLSYEFAFWGDGKFSWDFSDKFARYWVLDNHYMWDAWRYASRDVFYSYGYTPGIEPASVGYVGVFKNKQYNGANERITTVYNGSQPSKPNTYYNVKYGNPQY